MKEKDRLNTLFEKARLEKPIVDHQSIEKLIQSDKAVSIQKLKLGKPGRGLFNPLNLIVMFSFISVIVSLVFVLGGSSEEQEGSFQFSVFSSQDSVGGAEEMVDTVLGIGDSVLGCQQPGDGGAVETIVLSGNLEKSKQAQKDTVFQGEILELTNAELERIGFQFDENGYRYANQIKEKVFVNVFYEQKIYPKGKGTSSGMSMAPVVLKGAKAINKDYYPVCSTSIFGKAIYPITNKPDDPILSNFEFSNDTLIPVLIRPRELGGYDQDDFLLWFIFSNSFFDDIDRPNLHYLRDQYQYLKNLGDQKWDKDCMIYKYDLLDPGFGRIITLDRSYFACFGIVERPDSLIYEQFLGKGVRMRIDINKAGASSFLIHNKEAQSMSEDFPQLIYVYDTRFREGAGTIPTALFVEIDNFNSSQIMDLCIPIRFRSDPKQIGSTTTFWFYPNEQLIACLPDSIGIPMRKEFNLHVKPKMRGADPNVQGNLDIVGVRVDKTKELKSGDNDVPCEYFPSFCEGLPGLDNLNVYPNPTSGVLNLELNLNTGKEIDFRVFDLSGRLMIDEVKAKTYPAAGRYQERINLSYLETGFYLLVLTDEEGARMTRRIVKTQDPRPKT